MNFVLEFQSFWISKKLTLFHIPRLPQLITTYNAGNANKSLNEIESNTLILNQSTFQFEQTYTNSIQRGPQFA